MKRYFLINLIMICSCLMSFSQERDITSRETEIPKIIRLALPEYPTSAFPVGAEEKITIKLIIGCDGKVISSQFKTRFPPFRTALKKALKEWKFEESNEKIRMATISFEFTLLPYDSKSNISAILEFPDKFVIRRKKRKILN